MNYIYYIWSKPSSDVNQNQFHGSNNPNTSIDGWLQIFEERNWISEQYKPPIFQDKYNTNV